MKVSKLEENIIFDFDGTLVDSSVAVNKLYDYFAKKYNISSISSPETLATIKSLPLMEKMKKLGVPMRKLIAMSMEAKSMYASFISEIKLKEGMIDILKGLSERKADMSVSYTHLYNPNLEKALMGAVIAGFISSVTVGGKAIGKNIAIKNSKSIVLKTGYVVYVFNFIFRRKRIKH